MAASDIFCTVLLSVISFNVAAAQTNPIQFMTEVAHSLVHVGKTAQCLADHDMTAQAQLALAVTVSGVKDNIDGPLTEEKFGPLLHVVVSDTLKNLLTIDARCNNYCPRPYVNDLATSSDVYKFGWTLEQAGLIMNCLLVEPTAEIVAQFPVVIGGGMQAIAANTDTSLTSTGILVKAVDGVVSRLEQLSSNCMTVRRSC